jgi:kynurenine formamidase
MEEDTMRILPRITPLAAVLAAVCAAALTAAHAAEPRSRVPAPPWPAGDERGMANAIGPATWARCAPFLQNAKAKSYEISQIRSNTMPLSPFAGPYVMKPKATATLPFTLHAFNSETYNEGIEHGQEGTQIDAIGHFAYLKQPWDGKGTPPADEASYYGGYKQKDVKPTPDSLLLKLGMEKAPPLITTAVLLDAKALVGKGQPMKAGETVTAAHIRAMLKAQGLAKRGILPGDVVYVHTGWGDYWQDPDAEKFYYTKAPGLAYDAAQYLGKRRIVAIGLDAPFVDTVAEGMLQGKAPPAPGTPPGMPFAVHHHMLTQMGIHHIENAKLDELAKDKVWTSCTMILPLLEKGASGSAIRPVAIGVPRR